MSQNNIEDKIRYAKKLLATGKNILLENRLTIMVYQMIFT